jgi:phage terminase Nu1 subunit (DNA packaging protein)
MTVSARNQAELGELLGITQQAVSKLIKTPGWPVKKRGPWSTSEVRSVLDWHATLREQTHQGANDSVGGGSAAEVSLALKQMTVLLRKEQREKVKLENEIKRGKLVQRELLDLSLGGMADQFVNVIEQLRMNLPRRFPGIDKDGLDHLLDAYLLKLANQTEIQARSVDDAIAEARRRAAADKSASSTKKTRGRAKR